MEELAWEDIERWCEGDDNPVESPNDPIHLGPTAEKQVKELFWSFGLEKMPKTWVELVANLNYCERLEREVERLKSASPKVKEMTFERYNKEDRNFGEAVRILLGKEENPDNSVYLYNLHEAANQFYENTQNPRYAE